MSVFVELPRAGEASKMMGGVEISGHPPSEYMVRIDLIERLFEREDRAAVILEGGRCLADLDISYEEAKRRISEATAKAAGVPRFIRVTDNYGDLALLATDNISVVTRAVDVDDDDRKVSEIHFKGTSEMVMIVQHTVSEIAAMLGL